MLKILIISHYIAPTQAIGSIRWTKLAKYLKKGHDVEISVLTTKKNYTSETYYEKYSIDKLLEKDLQYIDHYTEFQSGRLRNAIFQLQRRLNGKKNDKLKIPTANAGLSGTEVYVKQSMRHSIGNIIKQIETNEIVKDGFNAYKKLHQQYDVIISSYGPVWCHLLAKRVKQDNPSAIWIADFRDVYAGNPYETEKEFNSHKLFVRKELKHASIITKVADGLELFEEKTQRVITLPNGFDPEERKKPLPPEKFDFVYTGTFYPNETSLLIVFKAIRELINEKKIVPEDVRIIYAGNNGGEFERKATTAGLDAYIHNMGSVQREKAIELQQKAAILLQSYAYTASFRSLWSGKMFEYMMASKPIVFTVIGDIPSEQYKLMPKLGGIGVETCRIDETYESMKNFIIEKYLEWKSTGDVKIKREEEYIQSFSYKKIADDVWIILNSR